VNGTISLVAGTNSLSEFVSPEPIESRKSGALPTVAPRWHNPVFGFASRMLWNKQRGLGKHGKPDSGSAARSRVGDIAVAAKFESVQKLYVCFGEAGAMARRLGDFRGPLFLNRSETLLHTPIAVGELANEVGAIRRLKIPSHRPMLLREWQSLEPILLAHWTS
jgi:hypothetical protein